MAEMGAAFLCATAGIDDPTIQNSAAYIHSWLRFLKSGATRESHSMSDSLKESWVVCNPVVRPTCVAGNGGV